MATQENEIKQIPHGPVEATMGSGSDSKRSSWDGEPELLKKNAGVDVNEIERNDGLYWKPGWRNQFPWIGLAGLIIVVLSTAMAVAILGLSNEKRTADWPSASWPIQPNVLLNIANQMQNLGLLTMIGQGLAIAWWRKVMKGSSLKELHRDHAYSYSFYSIMTSGKHFNVMALAALMTKFAVIDSTLFQKATKTEITSEYKWTRANVTAWTETNWTPHNGGIPGDAGQVSSVDSSWAAVIEAYNSKIANSKLHDLLEPKNSFVGCPNRQECSGSMTGLGFAFNCSTQFEDIDYGLLRSNSTNANETYDLWNINFSTKYATDNEPYASVLLNFLYVDSHAGDQAGSCPGKKTVRQCELRPAMVEYPIIVMVPSKEELEGKNIVTHIKFFNNIAGALPYNTPLNGDQIDSLKVVEYVDLNEKSGEVSTVGALTYVLNNLFKSSARLSFDRDWDIQVSGSSAQTTFYADTDTKQGGRCWYDIDKPGLDDPAVDLLRKANTLSFVTGLYSKGATNKNLTERQNSKMSFSQFPTTVSGVVEQYRTERRFVAGALVATLLTVLCVLPVYWRFWDLGRKVTLGPLEIAHAFNAPMIAPEKRKQNHGDFEEIIEEVGHRRVKYGQILNAQDGHMGIAEPHNVVPPVCVNPHSNTIAGTTSFAVGFGAAVGAVTAVAVGGPLKG